ncbi:hypothetical protein KJ633_01465 [bacterium]|nr:hypothetical protein [bacterium]MBU3955107.1 hypothetical protein [bacterium]MBU4133775.1 hypothetical protein [bacterium]
MFKTKIKSLNKIVVAVFIWIFLWMLSSGALMCLEVWNNFAIAAGFIGGISMAIFFYLSVYGAEEKFSGEAVNIFKIVSAILFVGMIILTFRYLLSQTSGRIALAAMILFLNLLALGILEILMIYQAK